MSDPSSSALPILSQVLGWSYFVAWSISFYPQIHLNYTRKSVTGLSLDFLYLNLCGFSFYTVYNAVFYWSPSIRAEYTKYHDGKHVLVELNDVLFGLHATLLTAVTIGQTWTYRHASRTDKPLVAMIIVPIVMVVFGVLLVLAGVGIVHWFALLYFMGGTKVFISLCKYLPQLWLNYRRKSTVGWSIGNILLDFTGGLLSVAQECVDAAIKESWGGITGNLPKFLLGLVSMFFDVLFMVQHYVLYKGGDGHVRLDG
jgi:LCT (Lysosomal Cystine Transporter) family transporter